ncbi:hypothetical protein [Kaistia sp. MMO-174]|uniref:hypothetical protein n=1 Tax=Kaistia sp. MMO-174 TaxID=3081256 RepID=UPI00301B3689
MSPAEDGGAVEGLVARLRAMAPTVGGTLSFKGRSTRAMNDDIRRAAAEITRLRAEVERKDEALSKISKGGTAYANATVRRLCAIARSALGDQP